MSKCALGSRQNAICITRRYWRLQILGSILQQPIIVTVNTNVTIVATQTSLCLRSIHGKHHRRNTAGLHGSWFQIIFLLHNLRCNKYISISMHYRTNSGTWHNSAVRLFSYRRDVYVHDFGNDYVSGQLLIQFRFTSSQQHVWRLFWHFKRLYPRGAWIHLETRVPLNRDHVQVTVKSVRKTSTPSCYLSLLNCSNLLKPWWSPNRHTKRQAMRMYFRCCVRSSIWNDHIHFYRHSCPCLGPVQGQLVMNSNRFIIAYKVSQCHYSKWAGPERASIT